MNRPSADGLAFPTRRRVFRRNPDSVKPGGSSSKEKIMILATTTVENVDRFLELFGTKAAEKRALHGSKGATVFRDPTEENRVWGLFDMDDEGWAGFVSDPDVPAILKEAGALGKPEAALMLGSYEA